MMLAKNVLFIFAGLCLALFSPLLDVGATPPERSSALAIEHQERRGIDVIPQRVANPSYLSRIKHYQAKRNERRSQDLVFNPVRQELLRGLFLNRNREFDLIAPALRRQIYQQSALPPGIQKQLVNGKPIPPGLRSRVIPLQPSVLNYLGIQNSNAVGIGILGDQVLLFDAFTDYLYDTTRQPF